MTDFAINLNKDSFVNERTGEVSEPSEFLSNLRAIETDITRADEDIQAMKADLKTAREAREKLVARLRGAVRDGTVLPLLEVEDDGLEVEDE